MFNLLTEEIYQRFRKLIYDSSGINFQSTNSSLLKDYLKDIPKKTGLNFLEYYNLVKHNDKEIRTLLDAVTINFTLFFRNSLQYEALQNFVLPDLVRYKNQLFYPQHIRLWSAGCSTGEEAYSNAMALCEWLPKGWSFEILASDLSLSSLMVAQKGWYSEAHCKNIPENWLNRYFVRDGKGFSVKPFLKELITFDYHNLKYPNDSGNFDIIFCRNVLIYFDEVAQVAVVEKFYKAMSAYSYLFLGHSESLFGFKTDFQFVKTNSVSLYAKRLHKTRM